MNSAIVAGHFLIPIFMDWGHICFFLFTRKLSGEENLQDIVKMLVHQMNRMENSIKLVRQSQTNQQTGTPYYGEPCIIDRDNISLYAPTDMALSGEVNQPSGEEREPCDTELIEGIESLCSSSRVKSTENRHIVAALFRKPTEDNGEIYVPGRQQQ